MSRAVLIRLCGGVAIVAAFGVYAARAQPPARGAPAGRAPGGEAKVKRLVYDVKLGVAKDLAEVLGKLFKADSDVQVLVAPAGNALVIGAPAKTVDEILQLLRKLDRRPRAVAIEVLIATVSPRKGEDGKLAPPARELNEAEFSGHPEDVLDKLQNLQKKGLIGSLQRLRLTATENHPGTVSNSAARPYTTGIVSRPGGRGARTITYRYVGTLIKATPRVGEDQRILLDLSVTDSRTRVPEDGPVLGADDDGKPVRATEFVNARFDGSLLLRSGQAVAAKGVMTKSRSGQEQTLVIVSARLVEPEAKGGK
jgi:hypothetical protein